MEPAIQPDDLLALAKMASYARGDIVAFNPPADFAQGEPFLKRVVALEGQKVQIENGDVLVGGAPLDEPYVYPGHEPNEPTTVTGDTQTWLVPTGEVFVLGDHRANSADSRLFGPIPVASIVGRVVWRCEPKPGPVT